MTIRDGLAYLGDTPRTSPAVRSAERGKEMRIPGPRMQETTRSRPTEDAARQGEELFRAGLVQATVGIAPIGPDSRWLCFNHRLCPTS